MCLANISHSKTFAEMFPELADVDPESVKELLDLNYQQGPVFLGSNIAKIDVGEDFYFLNAKDAQYVLADLWGNPPDPSTLGLLMPAGITPFHGGSWAVEIYFDDIGYVSDEDANDYDYSELLTTMKSDTRESSAWRVENGYDSIELVGWAAEPFYDQEDRKLHWAKELRFAGSEDTTLNYNIRALGRKGVLVMNFIAGMDNLAEVEQTAPIVMEMTNFTQGNTYSDFNPSIDKVAAVGIGGLIAGKVLAKTGFLVTALLLLKKFWFVLLLPLIALKNVIFGRKD